MKRNVPIQLIQSTLKFIRINIGTIPSGGRLVVSVLECARFVYHAPNRAYGHQYTHARTQVGGGQLHAQFAFDIISSAHTHTHTPCVDIPLYKHPILFTFAYTHIVPQAMPSLRIPVIPRPADSISGSLQPFI